MHPFIVLLHIGFLCLAALGIFIADHAAFNWMRGKTPLMGKKALFTAHWIVTTALLGLVYTGLVLFWPERDYLLTQPLFLLKMGFVAALLINSIVIEWLMHVAAHRPFASLSIRQKAPLFTSGAISTLSWLGAGLMGLLLFVF
jgi:hypothetical protein